MSLTKRATGIYITGAVLSVLASSSGAGQTGGALVAWYKFAENAGTTVHDQSPNHNDGSIIGPYAWGTSADRGLTFSGAGYVRVPSSNSLQLSHRFSIVAWSQGKGAAPRFVEHPPTEIPTRIPDDFQVCGDQLFFAYSLFLQDSSAAGWPMWVGKADVNLSSWTEHYTLVDGVEPKLQVVDGKIYYEYYARDGVGLWETWSAESSANLMNFFPVQRTFQPLNLLRLGLPTERAEMGKLMVAGGRIYYAFPKMDETDRWQLWTASSNRDGSDFQTQQRTTQGGWDPTALQVSGNYVYYMYPEAAALSSSSPVSVAVAKSRLDGTEWHTIARFPDAQNLYAAVMTVDRDRVYFSYVQANSAGDSQLLTGSMSAEGSDTVVIRQPVVAKRVDIRRIQVVGARIFYHVAQTDDSNRQGHQTTWVASADRDGSNWRMEKMLESQPEAGLSEYLPFVLVGGKRYYSAYEFYGAGNKNRRSLLGTSGSNIVSKGDAYGLGVSDRLETIAFVNVGQDYLYRGEAPTDIGGGATLGQLKDSQLHQLAETYDGERLTLYVDGMPVSSTDYNIGADKNEFPLLLGDGLVGTLKDVRIFNEVLAKEDLMKLYTQSLGPQ